MCGTMRREAQRDGANGAEMITHPAHAPAAGGEVRP